MNKSLSEAFSRAVSKPAKVITGKLNEYGDDEQSAICQLITDEEISNVRRLYPHEGVASLTGEWYNYRLVAQQILKANFMEADYHSIPHSIIVWSLNQTIDFSTKKRKHQGGDYEEQVSKRIIIKFKTNKCGGEIEIENEKYIQFTCAQYYIVPADYICKIKPVYSGLAVYLVFDCVILKSLNLTVEPCLSEQLKFLNFSFLKSYTNIQNILLCYSSHKELAKRIANINCTYKYVYFACNKQRTIQYVFTGLKNDIYGVSVSSSEDDNLLWKCASGTRHLASTTINLDDLLNVKSHPKTMFIQGEIPLNYYIGLLINPDSGVCHDANSDVLN